MSKTGTAVSFGYDADGLRVSKTVSGTTTKYYYTGSQLTDLKKGSDTLHFTYDVLGPTTGTYNGTVYYYLRNAQGDITGIVNSSGTQVVDYTYEAWGVKMSRTGSMAGTLGVLNPFRYRGYVYDEETELYYLKSRYYKPAWGRFINADIFVSTGQGLLGSNMFAYCNNNPVMGYDPNGEFFFTMLGAAAGFMGSFITSLALGNDFDTAIDHGVAGAVGGAVAGGGVDLGLLVLASGGTAAPLVACVVVYGFGGLGGMATTYISSEGDASINELVGSCIIGGTFNLISFGTSSGCAGKNITTIAYKGMQSLDESVVVGTTIATTSSLATHIGTYGLGNAPKHTTKNRRMVQ